MNHADRRYFNPDTAAGSHPATGFIRRALRWMLALLVTLFALTVIAQFLLASHLNRQSDTHDGIIVSRVITHAATDLQRQLHDYANWGDAWRHLHLALDVDWAWRDNNLAGTLYRDFGINGVFVLAPDGSTRYAVINGELSQHSLESWLGAPLSAVRRPVGEPPLIGVAGQPALLASAPITPGGDSRLGPGAGPWSQLIFVQLLTPTALQQLGEAYGITGLRVLPEREQPHHRLALPPWRFSWQADEPGRSLLLTMLPLTLLLGSLVAFGAGWLYRRALGKARLMDENSFLLAQSREALAASERRFRDVAEASTDWIWELDNQLNFTWISQRFPNLTGYSITQWQGRPITDLLQTEGEPLADWIRQPGERGHRRLLYCHYLSAQGHRRYCHLVMKPIYSRSGIEGYRGTATDVTLEVEAQARLQYMSRHDALTGLPNRKRMQEFLAGRLQAHATLDNPLAMIGVDLDQFKAINDRYGYQIGDRVLNVVSQRLSNCLQDTDLVTRQGGMNLR
nr:diguanylate cyclase [Pantoea sp. 1.19]